MERPVDDPRTVTTNADAAAEPDPRGGAETGADDGELTAEQLGDVSGGRAGDSGEVPFIIDPDG